MLNSARTEAAETIDVQTPGHEPFDEPLGLSNMDFYGVELANVENTEVDRGIFEPQYGLDGDPQGRKVSALKKASKDDRSKIIAVVSLLLDAAAFVLVVVATPLDVFRARNARSFIPNSDHRACFSMWGYKRCGAHLVIRSYTADAVTVHLPNNGWQCNAWRSRMTAAAAFSIISIFCSIAAVIVAALMTCRKLRGITAGVVGVLAMVALLITWTCLVASYYKGCNNTYSGRGLRIIGTARNMKDQYTIGVSFCLVVCSWGLQLFGAVLAFFA